MTRRVLALAIAAGLTLGACHKRDDAATLDAGADARARTAAKTQADLAAADQASAVPLPGAPAAPPRDAPMSGDANTADTAE